MTTKSKIKKVLVLGGSGLLGRYVIYALIDAGYHIRVITRRIKNANHLLPLPEVQIVEADVVNQPKALLEYVSDCTALINVIGISTGGRKPSQQPYSDFFKKAHVDLPKHIITAVASKKQLDRIVHISALGVNHNTSHAPSQYLRSKTDGENIIRHSDASWTIFRPSLILSPEAPFTRLVKNLVQYFPIITLPAADFKMQPVYAGDIAKAIVASLHRPEANGQIYNVAGPQVLTMGELVYRFAWYQRVNRILFKMPAFMAKLIATCLEWTPFPIMTRDHLASMSVESISHDPFPFDIVPISIDSIYQEHSTLTNLSRLRTYARR